MAVRAAEYIKNRHSDILSQRTTPSNANAPAL